MSYPVTHVVLTAAQAGALRGLHAAGLDTAVLARARELAAGDAERISTDQAWPAIERCLRGHYLIRTGQPVFGRRDWDIRLLGTEEVAATTAALSGVGQPWLRARFEDRLAAPLPGPVQPAPPPAFDEVWERFAALAEFFARARAAGSHLLFFTPSRFWRPPRQKTGADGSIRVVRPHYRPEDYTVDTSSTRTLPVGGGSWPIEAELTERDGLLYSWTEVERFTRGGRTWVRLTVSSAEFYIDVEIADDDRIGRIEAVDPLVAYWLARRADKHPVVLED